MYNNIDSFSINEDIWIHLNKRFINFRFKGFPNDVHLTISYNENSDIVNLHASRNINSEREKPRVRILEIRKEDLGELFNDGGLILVYSFLTPIDLEDLRKQFGDDLWFLDLHNGSKNYEEEEIFTKRFLEEFKSISRVKRKTRLKVNGDILKRIENFSQSTDVKDILEKRVKPLFPYDNLTIGAGVICAEDRSWNVIKIHDKWYELTIENGLDSILAEIIYPDILRTIKWKLKRAIVAVSKAQDTTELKNMNPIRLFLDKNVETRK